MSSFRIRPRFKLQVNFSIEQIQKKIDSELKKENRQCSANINNTFITLQLPENEIHYWSPQLRLSLEENDEGTLIRGLYGPKPSVWALFFYFYVAFGILGFFAGIYGLVQVSLDMPAPVLWTLPVLAICSVILYLFSQTGQKLGAQQMFTLHNFFESALNTKVSVT
jgi:hypothetical protein